MDYCAGLETKAGEPVDLLVRMGSNPIPGAIMLIGNEICGIALRIARNIDVNDETLAFDLIKKVGPGGHYLAERRTLQWLEKEHLMPSDVIDRLTMETWKKQGLKNMINRAGDTVNRILREYVPEPLTTDAENNLREVLKEIMNRYNIKSVQFSKVEGV